MIKPAKRVDEIKEYYFSTKLKEVAQMNIEGKDVISLGIGSPDMMPSPQTIEALCEWSHKVDAHGYQPYAGIDMLRQAFADWYQKWFHVSLNHDTEILPLMGSKEGVLHVSLAFLNMNDSVLIPNPGYPTYTSIAKLIGAMPVHYDLKEENGWFPDLEKMEKDIDLSKVKLMWVNYPNMPTGATASLEKLEQLVRFGKKHGIVIANDNPYSFILNNKLTSIFQIEGAKEICIELNSLSKSHNMAGWRMGVVASNAKFLRWILKVKSNIDSGQFKPMQLASVAALKNDDEWHRQMNIDLYARRRKLAEEIMRRLGCTFNMTQVGLFLWGKVPASFKGGKELADEVLYKANVFITPGFIFGSNGEKYIRISLCSTEERMKEALVRIIKMKESN